MKTRLLKNTCCMTLVIVIILSFSVSATAIQFTSLIDESAAIAIVNTHANTDVVFSIEALKPLKSISGDSYAYMLLDLAPYGYAIFSSSNLQLMEACFVKDSVPPLAINRNDVYYVGPTTFATKVNSNYIITEDSLTARPLYILTESDISSIQSVEQQVTSNINKIS